LSASSNHEPTQNRISTSSGSIVEQPEDQSRTSPASLTTLRQPQPTNESTSLAYTRLAPGQLVWGGANGNENLTRTPSLLSIGSSEDITYFGRDLRYNTCARETLPELASFTCYEPVANMNQQTHLHSLLLTAKTKVKKSKDKTITAIKNLFKKGDAT
jgi:hypothetical protein